MISLLRMFFFDIISDIYFDIISDIVFCYVLQSYK